MNLDQYINTVNRRYKSGISREHSYRGDFENLFKELVKGVEITNEPATVTDCGNPDYVITKGKIPIGYIEAKDIGKDLNSKSYKEQFGRYRKALDNLIITDYIWFQFFQNGHLVHEIRIADIENNVIKPLPGNFAKFENLLNDFSAFIGQTIKSSKKLAGMMAAKARLLQNILERVVTSDEETQENTSIQSQYATFKQILIHDLTPKAFADIYAQTLAYGMFAARLHDPTLEDFSRQEAAELIPKSNPFLRKLFGYVAGPDIDERIKTTVDNLADVYRATNVDQLLKNFGASTQQHDPIIHFYETFLAEYDPKLRKSRGVWYTPEPVVKFIVRAVDDILKTEFGLTQGLADTSKTTIKVNSQNPDKRSSTGYKQIEKEVHKVQILDPATGTGTFLAEVIKHIYSTRFAAMQGAWSSYVEDHLIPRLNGFELLMASYSMAHLKLDMLLAETNYKPSKNQRFNIFLTNSLEEHHPDTGTLFSNWLSTEANEA
ncbi:MAG: N-6 DNA methylase, partial [Bacteroidota bacterium]